MKQVNWGILGDGDVCEHFAAALDDIPEGELVAVASGSLEKAAGLLKGKNQVKVYHNYEQLIKDSNVDVIFIDIPIVYHKRVIELCIRYGKHVLCDKALTMNAKEAREIKKLAEGKDIMIVQADWFQFLPTTDRVMEWIKTERIGQLKYVTINYGNQMELDVNKLDFSIELGGGALLNMGGAAFSFVLKMMRMMPHTIQSSAYMGFTNVDETNTTILSFIDGTMVNVSTSISIDFSQEAEFIGTKGKIVIPNFFLSSRAYLCDLDGVQLERVHESNAINGYEYEIRELSNRIMSAKFDDVKWNTLDEIIDVLEVMDAVRGQWGLKYPSEENEVVYGGNINE
ncbi:putative oxidoreductase [Lachnospiraceae bacterium KM106-2]|nr:putative oxidoreductase [Lachnospiraceae bacterium KM106-2]